MIISRNKPLRFLRNIPVYVCVCHAITEKDVQKAIAKGADSVAMLSESTSLGTQCGHCTDHAQELIRKCCRQCP